MEAIIAFIFTLALGFVLPIGFIFFLTVWVIISLLYLEIF